MRLLGKVLGTFSAPKGSQSSMPRPKTESLNLIEGFGIENDKFAQKDLGGILRWGFFLNSSRLLKDFRKI